jgi:hypothetical protein
MNNAIQKYQEHFIEDFLIEIIVEPEYHGIEDVGTQRELVIDKLNTVANSAFANSLTLEQITELYDRTMAKDKEDNIRHYFMRNLETYCKNCKTIYHRMEDISYLWLVHQTSTRGKEEVESDSAMKRTWKLFVDTMESLEDAMLSLEDLSKQSRKAGGRETLL